MTIYPPLFTLRKAQYVSGLSDAVSNSCLGHRGSKSTTLQTSCERWVQAETIREADEAAVARGMDLDGEETSSAIKAADATEHAEGHGAVQYAAAAPTMLDTR